MSIPPSTRLDQVRNCIRLKHYSLHTEEAYTDWTRFFIRFYQLRHPCEMGKPGIEQFLSYLARGRAASALTQTQAKAALLFLDREVLEVELPWQDDIGQATRPQKLPVVLTRAEI